MREIVRNVSSTHNIPGTQDVCQQKHPGVKVNLKTKFK